jgi:hypothetical protein
MPRCVRLEVMATGDNQVGHGVIVIQTRTCAVRLQYVVLAVVSIIGSLAD